MLRDLDKWNPFRFLRENHEGRGAAAQARAQGNDQQGGTQQETGSGTPAADAASTRLGSVRQPLSDPLQRLNDLIRDPFGGLGLLGSWFGDFSPSQFQPRVDVIDDGDALRIVAELPGLTRDEVELEVIEDMLVLSGDKRIESKMEEKGCYRVERSFGHFQRAIPIPTGIDLDGAEAKFDNGILTVRIPKAPGVVAAKRPIEIK
ncbi:HSP20 family protein [Paraburkholderia sp. BL8N3]|nr:Hsp20/alpha crystallin family protein [Paraburkholderia sp. BL8N3]TCK32823.1 HSP20 family protein [Paraburkholderia sp. BL8N3]